MGSLVGDSLIVTAQTDTQVRFWDDVKQELYVATIQKATPELLAEDIKKIVAYEQGRKGTNQSRD